MGGGSNEVDNKGRVIRAAVFDEEVPALERCIDLLKVKFATVFKAASMVFGFSIFLVYFVQNGFYPDVDLWGFGSLLCISAFFGFLLTLYFSFGLSVPGVVWKEFHSDSDVMRELHRNLSDSGTKRTFYQTLISRCFFLPVFFNAILAWCIVCFGTGGLSDFLAWFVLPAMSGLVFSLYVWKVYSLTKYSVLKFLVFGGGSFVLVSVVSWVLGFAIYKGGLLEQASVNKDVQLLFALMVSVLLIFFMTFVLHMKKSYTVFVGGVIGVFAMLVAGVWGTMPGALVRNLGIGNYTAESVILKEAECTRLKSTDYPISDSCELKSIHVVWAWGGSYQFRFSDGRRIRIEKDSIGPIVERAVEKVKKAESL